jgi:hypothetical protein
MSSYLLKMGNRGKSRAARWPGRPTLPLIVLGMALLSPLSACLSDVGVPACVLNGTCKEELAKGGTAGSSAVDPGATETGGEGGASFGGAAGEGGARPLAVPAGAAGEGGAPAAPACQDCFIGPIALTPGCTGHMYALTLSIGGGSAPYSWQLTQAPEGWSVAAAATAENQAILHGDEVPEGGVTLTVNVTDAHGLVTTRTLQVEARNSCWFAATAAGDAGGQLLLFDPLSQRGKIATLKHNANVYDFRFSPDGKWLAYRYDAAVGAPHAGSLAIVDLESLSEQDVLFGDEGFITSYAWGPSSEILAAAFVDGTQVSLGAVRLPTATSADLVSLGVTKANVDSPLAWVGDRYLVFHGPKGPPGLRAVYYALLGPTGFQAPKETFAPAPAPLTIAPNAQGFFMISPEQVSFNSLLNDTYRFEDHPWDSLVSPSGRTTAVVNDEQLLEVRAAGDSATVITSQAGHTCPLLLASSPGSERIACVADVPMVGGGVRGEVRFFDAGGSDDLPLRTLGGYCEEDLGDMSDSSCLHQLAGYSYGVEQAAGTARGFSPSGRYFAFARTVADITYVYWADLQQASPKLVGSIALAQWDETQPLSALSFSPDERFLFVQRGARLAMADVLTSVYGLVSANETNAPPCSEELINPAFCGNPNGTGTLQLSADSQALAMRTAQQLHVFDLSPFPDALYTYLFRGPFCGAACAGDFAFQPRMLP